MPLGLIPEARSPREDELERDEKFQRGRKILVAIDHGTTSQAAFTWALDQFATHADTLHLMHVMPKASTAANPLGAGSGSGPDSPLYQATQMLFDKLTKEAYQRGNVRVVTAIKNGEVGHELCNEASNIKATTIVLGSRGMGRMKSLLVGSTAEYCIRHSTVPLTIIPHDFQCDGPVAAPPDGEHHHQHQHAPEKKDIDLLKSSSN